MRLEYSDFIYTTLQEKRGVWNRIKSDYKGTHQEHVNNIYNWVRTEIIDNLNKGSNNFIFDIPIGVYAHLSPLKEYNKIIIKYNKTSNPIIMSCKSNNIKEITLTINASIFDDKFKSVFFHEVHHMCQLSSANYKTSSTPVLINMIQTFYAGNISPQYITDLYEQDMLIYYYNHLEVNAHKEQVYTDTFNYVITHPQMDKNAIYKHMKTQFYKQFYILSSDNLLKKITYKSTHLLAYIWCLIFQNYIYSLNKPNNYFQLFPKKIYRHKLIQKIIQNIKYYESNYIQYDLYEIVEKDFNNFLQDTKLVNDVIYTFKFLITTRYQSGLQSKIQQAMDIAIEDALNGKEDEFIFDYVKIYHETMEAEIICIDNKTKNEKIFSFRRHLLEDIFRLKAILDLYLNLNSFSVKFGFLKLDTMYNDWLIKHPEYSPNNNNVKKPNITTLNNMVHLVKYISAHF